eukprot:m.75562 g.75562  ORF g.75562 m.75562 type:complete len:55 (+) comp16177_c0_seq1:237-401(+)
MDLLDCTDRMYKESDHLSGATKLHVHAEFLALCTQTWYTPKRTAGGYSLYNIVA